MSDIISFLQNIRPFFSSTEKIPSTSTGRPSTTAPKEHHQFDLSLEQNFNQEELQPPPVSTPSKSSATPILKPAISRRPTAPKDRVHIKPSVIKEPIADSTREDDEQLFQPPTIPADFFPHEPKPIPSAETSTESKVEEEEVKPSSTLFPPFSKRARPSTTPTTTTASEAFKPSSTESSPVNGPQIRITSYKQRIEAMKEQAKQREQQAQHPSKHVKETEAAVLEQETIEVMPSSSTSTTKRPSTTRPKVPPRMPTRKPLFSSSTTTALPKATVDDETSSIDHQQQPRRRFKPKQNNRQPEGPASSAVSEAQDSEEKVKDLPKSHDEAGQPQEDERNDSKGFSAEEQATNDSSVKPTKIKTRQRPVKITSTTAEPAVSMEQHLPPSMIEPDKQVDQQEEVQHGSFELISRPEHQVTTGGDNQGEENPEEIRHGASRQQQQDDQNNPVRPESFFSMPIKTVPMSPDLSDPVSKARKQFFAMATHDPILPIEELLNIRIRDNGKGM